MNSNYHINGARPQSSGLFKQTRTNRCGRLIPATSIRPMRIPVAVTRAAPLLIGDRETLRKLRAAEMAAWESIRPNTAEAHHSNGDYDEPAAQRKTSRAAVRLPVWLILILAACGSVALSLDLQDVSLFLTGWSQLVSGIRSLFA